MPVAHRWVSYDYWELVCAIEWSLGGTDVITYVIIAFFTCFALPGIILAMAYTKVSMKNVTINASHSLSLV